MSAKARIEFLDSDVPGLPDGDYVITARQTLTTPATLPGQNKIQAGNVFSAERGFSVAGPRFRLDPSVVRAVFPPAGSIGDHSNVLPHILFHRTSLPWERLAQAGDDLRQKHRPPWLALLLFEAGEAPATQTMTLSELQNQSASAARFSPITLEQAQHPDDKVTVIDLPFEMLEDLIPSAKDLTMLAHVRQTMDENEQKTSEIAAVIGNRLPPANGESVVHLVSLENRFNEKGFDFQGAGKGDLIRLVSLYSWRFSCISPAHTFKELLKNLNREPSLLQLPNVANNDADWYLKRGFVPISHHLRDGTHGYAWYHSPLTPGPLRVDQSQLPVRAADELLRYDANSGFLDVSYAAAWELGRLLMLQSKPASKSLFHWKRQRAQVQRLAEQKAQHAHISYHLDVEEPDTPSDLLDWFNRLRFLEGVPFQYLVPDESMLPPESIRFIALDRFWVDCLLDGAASIGRVSGAEHSRDASLLDILRPRWDSTISGFIMRSQVMAGWPDLLADAFDRPWGKTEPVTFPSLDPLRFARLGPDVLLALYHGNARTVDIHQKPEALHFGLDRVGDGSSNPEFQKDSKPIRWRNTERYVIEISEMAKILSVTSSANFALAMIEGVQKVRFTRGEIPPR